MPKCCYKMCIKLIDSRVWTFYVHLTGNVVQCINQSYNVDMFYM